MLRPASRNHSCSLGWRCSCMLGRHTDPHVVNRRSAARASSASCTRSSWGPWTSSTRTTSSCCAPTPAAPRRPGWRRRRRRTSSNESVRQIHDGPFDASRRSVLPDALGLRFGGDSAFAENELRVRSDGPPVVVLRSPRQYRDAQRSVLLILMIYRSLSMGAPITGALFSCPFPVQNAGFYRTNCSLQPARCGHLQMFKVFPSRGFLALQHRTGTIPLTRCVSSLPTWAVRFEFAS